VNNTAMLENKSGQISWPPMGISAGHQWAVTWPPMGSLPWPLTALGDIPRPIGALHALAAILGTETAGPRGPFVHATTADIKSMIRCLETEAVLEKMAPTM
ncbi:hypothetical protein, partial [Arthrobacter sp. H35-D1]|uniref:hypothetical protein n=1 Tax=Arthrobacter sp. H35-D1 TaxID=3046202 RepID=UPI0024BAC460